MSKILWLKGKQAGDYFNIICETCETPTNNEYLGWDPGVPRFKATCEKCKTTTILKLGFWTGLPREPLNTKAKLKYRKQKEKKLLQYFETLTPEEQQKIIKHTEYRIKQKFLVPIPRDNPFYKIQLEEEKFEQIDLYRISKTIFKSNQ